MSNEILLIGNSGVKYHGIDGQTAKVRLYLKKIRDEGFNVDFIDLEDFIKRPISILLKIKKGIKKCDRIVLISASRGCKFLIPFINKNNKKYRKPFILPLIGISVLHFQVDKLSEQEKLNFIVNGKYCLCKQNKKMAKELSKLTYVLPETDLLARVYKEFYKLNNAFVLNNFRDHKIVKKKKSFYNDLKLVFLSRVTNIKGIFDILEVVKTLNENGYKIKLDVYGKKILNHEEDFIFNSYIDGKKISYCGVIDNGLVCETISNYDLFVFPTRYLGEGTPGVISESLLAGIPIFTSDFPQAKYLLNNGKDSLFYKMFDKEDLAKKLINVFENKDLLVKMKNFALKSGDKYTYEFERDNFLKFICGRE